MKEGNLSNAPLARNNLKQKKKLKNHIKSVHEGKKSFKCTNCKIDFEVEVEFKKHLKLVHKSEVFAACGCPIGQSQ